LEDIERHSFRGVRLPNSPERKSKRRPSVLSRSPRLHAVHCNPTGISVRPDPTLFV
jgi:hypothetical protein